MFSKSPLRKVLLFSSFGITFSIFLIDLFAPTGIIAPFFYLIPIFITFLIKPKKTILLITFVCIILTFVGHHAALDKIIDRDAFLNRLFVIFSLGIVAFFLIYIRRYQERLREAFDQLRCGNERLKKAKTELEEVNKQLEQFTNMASHDLRSPLSTIGMFCELLSQRIPVSDQDQKEYLDMIKASVKRQQMLIRDLLDMAKTSNVETPANVDLNEVLKEIIADLEVLIRGKKAQVNFDALPTVKANPTHMRQLFQNLIDNALKYSRQEVSSCIFIRHKMLSDSLEISVEDNRMGMKKEYLEKMFIPFQRFNAHIEGTGLGLPLCKKIVEQYGGKMTGESTPNHGTVFYLNFPTEILATQESSLLK